MLSLKEAAERTGRSPDTLRKAAERGTLAARKIGKTWMTTVEEADRYARENVGKPGPKPKRTDLMIGMGLPITAEDFARCGWEMIVTSSAKKDCQEYERLFVDSALEAKRSGAAGAFAALVLLGAVCDMFLKPDDRVEPLQPKMIFRGMRSTAIQDFRDDQLSVFSQVLPTIDDAELRARIADILWLRRGDGRAAGEAVESYLAAATVLAQDEWPSYERVHRAYQLASRLGRRAGYLATVLQYIEDRISRYNGTEMTVMPLRYMELLLAARHGDPGVYIPLARHLAEDAEAAREWFRARFYWQNVAAWQERAKGANAERDALIRAAETHISEANDAITPPRVSYLTAAAHIESALEAYQRIPNTEAKRRLLRETLFKYQEKGMSEMAHMPFEINVTETVEKAIEMVRGKPLAQALLTLAGCSASPSVVDMRESVEAALKQFPLQSMMPKVTFGSNGFVVAKTPGGNSDDPKDKEASVVAGMLERLRLHHLMHAAGVIEPARSQILSEHPATLNDLAQFVSDNPLIPQGRDTIYARGLLAGIDGDYLTATHLLVPQIEHALRHFLRARRVSTFQIDNDGIQREIGLDRILIRSECVSVLVESFGEDLIFDLRALLIEPLGGKIRHAMAHGLMELDAFATPAVVYLWWLALRFCCLPFLVKPLPQELSKEAGGDNGESEA